MNLRLSSFIYSSRTAGSIYRDPAFKNKTVFSSHSLLFASLATHSFLLFLLLFLCVVWCGCVVHVCMWWGYTYVTYVCCS